ncbi:MAG: VanZ family protein [Balneolaceae bacterium]|nr:MAG: VanZ family protein [Balneolaceae bacterium]
MRFRYLLPVIAWTIIIFFIIAIPGSSIPDSSLFQIPHFDKIIHSGIFFVLGLFSVYGFIKQGDTNILKSYAYTSAVIFCVIYGGLTEVIQHFFIAERFGEIADFIANIIGSVAGVAVFYYLAKTHKIRKILSL